jgi:hypothetical protein
MPRSGPSTRFLFLPTRRRGERRGNAAVRT